jgi:phage recombination protein Bet
MAQFIRVAVEFQLNPYKREIYCFAYGTGEYQEFTIIVGYEVYIKRAERTKKLDGWKAWIEDEGENLKAKLEIYRKDWQHPFTHEVYWKEAVQKKRDGTTRSFWMRMPKFQLKKVAISQGFRLCFPDELGGLPYEGAEVGVEVIGLNDGNPADLHQTDDTAKKEGITATGDTVHPAPAQEEKAANNGNAKPGDTKAAPSEPPPTALPTARDAKEAPVEKPPVKQPSGNQKDEKLHDKIKRLMLENKHLLSSSHQTWIVNQLRQEKTEAQLNGVLKHLNDCLAKGGDPPEENEGSKRQNTAQKPPKANKAELHSAPAGDTRMDRREQLKQDIEKILTAVSESGEAYLTEKEKAETRQIIKTTSLDEKGIKDLEELKTLMGDELKKRKAKQTSPQAA